MTDPLLFAIGCGVVFLWLGGSYVILREQYLRDLGEVETPPEPHPPEATTPEPGHVQIA